MGLKRKAIFVAVAAVAIYYFLHCRSCGNFNPASIKGKRVVITGASSGIGEEMAYQYSRLGAKLVITARRENLLEKVSKKCLDLGAEEVRIVKADMSVDEDRVKLIEITKKVLGGIDQLILNHVYITPGLWDGTKENITAFRKMLEIDFFAYVEIASHFLPMLKESKGNIGVVSSVAGKIPIVTLTSYSASKFALHGFFGALRQELSVRNEGVSITLCVLGFIGTDAALEFVKEQERQTGKEPPMSPVAVDETALAIIRGVTEGVREVYYPRAAKFMVGLHKLVPNFMENLMKNMANPNDWQ